MLTNYSISMQYIGLRKLRSHNSAHSCSTKGGALFYPVKGCGATIICIIILWLCPVEQTTLFNQKYFKLPAKKSDTIEESL
jgi:hypothetical protein